MDMKMTFSGFVLAVLVTTVVGSSVRGGEVSGNLNHCWLPAYRQCLLECWSLDFDHCYARCTTVLTEEFGADTNTYDCTIYKVCYYRCYVLGKPEAHCWEETAGSVTGKVTDLVFC
nr:conotoxin precursor Cver04 [Conus judaeus]